MGEIIVLRLIHVMGGIFWVGSAVFNFIYLFPALAAAGPAAGPILGSMQQRRLFTVLPAVAILTILSGLRLMWIASGGFAAAYFRTGGGATFAAAAVLAIIAFTLGILVNRPAGVRMAQIRQTLAGTQDPAARAALSAELEALQRRNGAVGRAITWLLILAAAGMATARYIP